MKFNRKKVIKLQSNFMQIEKAGRKQTKMGWGRNDAQFRGKGKGKKGRPHKGKSVPSAHMKAMHMNDECVWHVPAGNRELGAYKANPFAGLSSRNEQRVMLTPATDLIGNTQTKGIEIDPILSTYAKVWQNTSEDRLALFSQSLVDDIWSKLKRCRLNVRDVTALEASGILELYLWPHIYEGKSSTLLKEVRAHNSDQKEKNICNETETTFAERYFGDHVNASLLIHPRKFLTKSHILLIALMCVEKFRDLSNDVQVWESIRLKETLTDGIIRDTFAVFFTGLLDILSPYNTQGIEADKQHGMIAKRTSSLDYQEKTLAVQFLLLAFNSYEQDAIRESVVRICGMPCWLCLSSNKLEDTLARYKRFKKAWKRVCSEYEEMQSVTPSAYHARYFLSGMLDTLFAGMEAERKKSMGGNTDPEFVLLLERTLELFIDLMTQLPLRRCFKPLLEDRFVVVRVGDFITAVSQYRQEEARLRQNKVGGDKGQARNIVDGQSIKTHQDQVSHNRATSFNVGADSDTEEKCRTTTPYQRINSAPREYITNHTANNSSISGPKLAQRKSDARICRAYQ